MNPIIKEKWIAALRSGEYEQGRDQLRSPFPETGEYMYCCLGVLCDLFVKEHPDVHWQGGALDIEPTEDLHLPHGGQRWAGLDRSSPRPQNSELLTNLNDAGMSFEDIARVIEGGL